MQVINKIMRSGAIVGYTIDYGIKPMATAKKALYLENIITQLINSGYHYYDYDPDHIEDANGIPISELPAVPFEEVDAEEFNGTEHRGYMSALSDADASRYYSFRAANVVKFKQESSYAINTREELINHLKALALGFNKSKFGINNKPLNSYVNPDVLFTVEEIAADVELKNLFNAIQTKHVFKNYQAYRDLCKWFVEQGVLTTETPSTAEFLNAYYAWGPEGIKNSCIKRELKMNVDGDFAYIGDTLATKPDDPSIYAYANRRMYKGVYDKDTKCLQAGKKKVDISGIVAINEYPRIPIAPASDDTLIAYRKDTSSHRFLSKGTMFQANVTDRLMLTLAGDRDINYLYKVSHNAIRIIPTTVRTDNCVFFAKTNFGVRTIHNGILIPIDELNSEVDVLIYNMAIATVYTIADKGTRETTVKSTREMLRKEGLGPVSITTYCSNAISMNNSLRVHKKYVLNPDIITIGSTMKVDKTDFNQAFDIYIKPIPEHVLDAFGIKPEELENGVDTFMELADVDYLLDIRENMSLKNITPNDDEFDWTCTSILRELDKADNTHLLRMQKSKLGVHGNVYDAVDYYTNLAFVKDCISGNYTGCYFGEGLIEDYTITYDSIVETIVSVIYAVAGDTPTVEESMKIMHDIIDGKLINISNMFTPKDNAYHGLLVDTAMLHEKRAGMDCGWWIYCTKIFREISNKPVEEQRPYMMELVEVSKFDKNGKQMREIMTELVNIAIDEANFSDKPFGWILSSWSLKKCVKACAADIAARLFFYILAGGIKDEPVDDNYTVNINVMEDIFMDIKIPSVIKDMVCRYDKNSHKRYVTLFDFCLNEFDPQDKGSFNYYLVNADVDPWHVIPRKGYSIKTYPLLPNYYAQTNLDAANGEGFYMQACNNKSIVVNPITYELDKKFLVQSQESGDEYATEINKTIIKEAKSVEELELFFNEDLYKYEYIAAYVKRWALERKKARAMGKTILSIPLKQDILLNSIAAVYCDVIPSTTPEYADDNVTGITDKAAQLSMDVGNVSWKHFLEQAPTAIANTRYTMRKLDVRDIGMEFEEYKDILSDVYECPIGIFATSTWLVIKYEDKDIKIPVAKYTTSDFDKLAEEGIILKLANCKYFVGAVNGNYILEVNNQ